MWVSCEKNKDTRYSVCNDMILSTCDGSGEGAFCTIGLKWGENNPFSDAGLETYGPSPDSVEITYSFTDSGYTFNTHTEDNLIGKSFDGFLSCSKDKVREAFSEWESVADIRFVEKMNGENCNLKIIIAEIKQAGLGYPAYPNEPCSELAGKLIFNSESNHTCESFFYVALHEIGHVLGLGHVISNNVMNPDKSYLKLQSGDIMGIQSIYGKSMMEGRRAKLIEFKRLSHMLEALTYDRRQVPSEFLQEELHKLMREAEEVLMHCKDQSEQRMFIDLTERILRAIRKNE